EAEGGGAGSGAEGACCDWGPLWAGVGACARAGAAAVRRAARLRTAMRTGEAPRLEGWTVAELGRFRAVEKPKACNDVQRTVTRAASGGKCDPGAASIQPSPCPLGAVRPCPARPRRGRHRPPPPAARRRAA